MNEYEPDFRGEALQTPAGSTPRLATLLDTAPTGSASARRLAEIVEIEEKLRGTLEAEVAKLLEDVPSRAGDAARHLVDAGGKRLRPLLALVAAGAVGERPEKALPVAAAVELLHTGSLLHDDVVDEGDLRRGRPAAQRVFGNPVAVLAGDFCILSALDSVLRLRDMPLLERTMVVARELTEAELRQLEQRSRPTLPDPEACLAILDRKTASLFALSTWGGARCAWAADDIADRLDRFGRRLGLAFQVVDDLLDVAGDSLEAGKSVGRDLAQGTVTLPVIEAAAEDQLLGRRVAALLQTLSQDAGFGAQERDVEAEVRDILQGVARTGAVARCRDRAATLTRAAVAELGPLPASPYRSFLEALGGALLDRVS